MYNDNGCDWYCDKCGTFMNSQSGFSVTNGTWVCTECGFVNDVTEDNIREDTPDYYSSDTNDYDEVPEGCRACGGPYPQCTTSCKLFDD